MMIALAGAEALAADSQVSAHVDTSLLTTPLRRRDVTIFMHKKEPQHAKLCYPNESHTANLYSRSNGT